ncbi:putative aminocyclopropanecarboxylate oxidase [Helianthus annuus]|nr:putative aminocyclopropanecarboxylate oxidase [Helianthus annuus]
MENGFRSSPSTGTLVVNISDVFQVNILHAILTPTKQYSHVWYVLQVLSNKKFKSATHRVVRPEGRIRHSYVFFYNLQGDKWVEPLPKFAQEIGLAAKYRGFYYKDYQALRLRNKTHPQSNPEDIIRITHYEI